MITKLALNIYYTDNQYFAAWQLCEKQKIYDRLKLIFSGQINTY